MSSLVVYMFMLLYSVTADITASTTFWFLQSYVPERLTEINNYVRSIDPNLKRSSLLTAYLNSPFYKSAYIALIVAIILNSLVLIYSIYNIWPNILMDLQILLI